MSKLEELRAFLSQLAPGPVVEVRRVEHLLSASWHTLVGNQSGGMEAYKLLNRTEKMTWTPPLLGFEIERHGRAAYGSVYADIQTWRIDVQDAKAMLEDDEKRRLVRERDKPLKIEPILREIEELILNQMDDLRLKWLSPTSVRINISEVIPATNAQTTLARRQRFKKALETRLKVGGWQKIAGKLNTFSLQPKPE